MDLNSFSILIVEDEESLRSALKDALEREGVRVLEAGDGQDGLKQAVTNHPDLILLDLVMPKMNGIDALKELRRDDWGREAKVIVLTNLDQDDQVMQEMAKTEPTYYLIKSQNMLIDVVERVKEVLLQSQP